MANKYNIDFSIATSEQVEKALCNRIKEIRLSRNMTQIQLAEEAGLSEKTIRRFEDGKGVSLDTFIRVLQALGLWTHLISFLPDPTIRPAERLKTKKHGYRKKARPKLKSKEPSPVVWPIDREVKK